MTMRGPYLSTNQASTGTSQVSVTTNRVKASWIAARPQWNFASIGSTNRVQPYCRLAIMAMQTMPMASCIQRKPLDVGSACAAAVVPETMIPPTALLGSVTQCRKVVTDCRRKLGIIYSNMQATSYGAAQQRFRAYWDDGAWALCAAK